MSDPSLTKVYCGAWHCVLLSVLWTTPVTWILVSCLPFLLLFPSLCTPLSPAQETEDWDIIPTLFQAFRTVYKHPDRLWRNTIKSRWLRGRKAWLWFSTPSNSFLLSSAGVELRANHSAGMLSTTHPVFLKCFVASLKQGLPKLPRLALNSPCRPRSWTFDSPASASQVADVTGLCHQVRHKMWF